MGVLDRLLDGPAVYVAVQRAIGADEARSLGLESLAVEPGMRLLDLGCGPAYYVNSLPREVEYLGFDTDSRYVEWARAKNPDREFRVEMFTSEHAERLGPFDRIMLFGLLHHLDDDDAANLLGLCARVLTPDGVVVAIDTCFDSRLTKVEEWMARKDRGRYVRSTSTFEAMGEKSFDSVSGTLLERGRMPMRLWLMRMTGPLNA